MERGLEYPLRQVDTALADIPYQSVPSRPVAIRVAISQAGVDRLVERVRGIARPVGAKAAHRLPVKKLKRVFASILYVLAAYMLWKGLKA